MNQNAKVIDMNRKGRQQFEKGKENDVNYPLAVGDSYHAGAKYISPDKIDKVVKNRPLHSVPRTKPKLGDEEKKEVLARIVATTHFPNLDVLWPSLDILEPDDGIKSAVADHIEALESMKIGHNMIGDIREELKSRMRIRQVLRFIYDEDLVKTESILPIEYLPDLFMAAPVWFFHVNEEDEYDINRGILHRQRKIEYFSKLLPNNNWMNLFQIYNRRIRPLSMYKGDVFPPHVLKMMAKASELFDHVAVATPYHRVAGNEWEEMAWEQLPDPFVLGFNKDLKLFFVLARFSNSGTFPLYNDMVADTVDFLKEKRESFRKIGKREAGNDSLNWFTTSGYLTVSNIGESIFQFADQLSKEFKNGNLFDWLRGGEATKEIKEKATKATEATEETRNPKGGFLKAMKKSFARFFG
jgi:hypothetical protein